MYLKKLLFILLLLLVPAGPAAGEPGVLPSLLSGFSQDCSFTMRAVGFVTTTKVADTSRNPGNRIMTVPSLTEAMHLRPDMQCSLNRFSLLLQPRFTLSERSRTTDTREHHQVLNEFYLQQWLVRWGATDDLYLSYGRENLQWGPASLTSVSNPFFADNGKTNPKLEVDTMDFARAVWVVNPTWTLSFITNTDKGRADIAPGDFTPRSALKIDFTGPASYGSLIVSAARGTLDQALGFFGWTVSDALLFYSEGVVQQGSTGRYPRSQPSTDPLGFTMSDTSSDDRLLGSILLGTAYTLASGPTLTLEYLHYGPGYNDTQARKYFTLMDNAANASPTKPGLGPAATQALGSTADPGLRFLRRNYLMFQYQQNDIGDFFNLTLRLTRNLDDNSNRFNAIGEWFINDTTQLFAVGTADRGSNHSEFKNIIDYQLMLGMVYYF